MSTTDDKGLLGLFFSGNKNDNRGSSFFSTSLANPYTAPLNANPSADDRSFVQLAKVESYFNKSSGMQPDDMHNEYLDFVIQTALWHRHVDMPTGEDAYITKIRDVIESIATVMGSYYTSFADFIRQPHRLGSSDVLLPACNVPEPYTGFYGLQFPTGPPFGYPGSVVHSTLPNARYPLSEVFFVLTPQRATMSTFEALLAEIVFTVRAIFETKTVDEVLTDSQVLLRHFSQIIVKILFEGKNVNWHLGQITGVERKNEELALFRYPVGYKAPRELMVDALNKYSITGVSNIIASTRPELERDVADYLTTVVRATYTFYTEYKRSHGNVLPLPSPPNVQALEVPFINSCLPNFQDGLFRAVSHKICGKLKHFIFTNHTTLTDSGVYELHKYIHKGMSEKTLSTKVEHFIKSDIELLKQSGKSWSRVTDYPSISSSETSKYRLNLRKLSGPGSDITTFESSLPLIQRANKFSGFWYTSWRSGSPQLEKLSQFSVDTKNFLQFVYHHTYVAMPRADQKSIEIKYSVTHPPVSMHVPAHWKNITNAPTYFSVDPKKLISSMMQPMQAYRTAVERGVSGEMYDLFQNTYKVDDNGVVRSVATDTIYARNPDLDELTCGSSLIPFDNDSECIAYLSQCVNSGDPDKTKRVERCVLDLGRIKDFHFKAHELDTKIHPDTIRKTILALGFDGETRTTSIHGKSITYTECESLNNWLDKLSKTRSDLADKVKNNSSLYNYLNAMVHFINANPKLLSANRNIDFPMEKGSKLPTLDYAKSLGLDVYRKPGLLTKFHNMRGILSRWFPVSSLQFGRGTGGRTRISNIGSFVPFASNAFAPQRGGNLRVEKYSQASSNESMGAGLLNRLYKSIEAELKAKNKTISESSNARIKDLIEKYKNAEQELTNSLVQLEKYLWLLDIVRDTNKRDNMNLDDIHEMVKSHEELANRFKRTQDKIYNVMFGLVKITNSEKDSVLDAYADAFKNRQLPDRYPGTARASVPLF
jgi:hypothetical protein